MKEEIHVYGNEKAGLVIGSSEKLEFNRIGSLGLSLLALPIVVCGGLCSVGMMVLGTAQEVASGPAQKVVNTSLLNVEFFNALVAWWLS